MASNHLPGLLDSLGRSAVPEEVPNAHAEPISNQVGQTHNYDDSRRRLGPGGARYHGKGDYRAIHGSEHDVS